MPGFKLYFSRVNYILAPLNYILASLNYMLRVIESSRKSKEEEHKASPHNKTTAQATYIFDILIYILGIRHGAAI